MLTLRSFEQVCALTRLDSDCGGVSDSAGVDGVDGEGVVSRGVQLGHHGGADIRFQINLAGEAPSVSSFQRLMFEGTEQQTALSSHHHHHHPACWEHHPPASAGSTASDPWS